MGEDLAAITAETDQIAAERAAGGFGSGLVAEAGLAWTGEQLFWR